MISTVRSRHVAHDQVETTSPASVPTCRSAESRDLCRLYHVTSDWVTWPQVSVSQFWGVDLLQCEVPVVDGADKSSVVSAVGVHDWQVRDERSHVRVLTDLYSRRRRSDHRWHRELVSRFYAWDSALQCIGHTDNNNNNNNVIETSGAWNAQAIELTQDAQQLSRVIYSRPCPLDFNRTAFTDFVPACVMF